MALLRGWFARDPSSDLQFTQLKSKMNELQKLLHKFKKQNKQLLIDKKKLKMAINIKKFKHFFECLQIICLLCFPILS